MDSKASCSSRFGDSDSSNSSRVSFSSKWFNQPDIETGFSSQQTNSNGTLDEDKDSAFYFESDHLALKGNKDYHCLLRTVAMLEAQRIKAIEDLDKLIDCEKEALADPIAFVEKLQRKIDLGIRGPQKVCELPKIQWENYTSNMDPMNLYKRKHLTRTSRIPAGTSERTEEPQGDGSVEVVRGRLRDQTKPQTFNRLWTSEEQRHLEELLIIYPPEEVEARRWDKIARALGDRTPQQVASRVQKYFIKLAKAGLPIPGRIPNIATYSKKCSFHRHQRNNRFYFQSSTFLTSYEPPVYMSDDDDITSYTGSSNDTDLLQQDQMIEEQDLSDDDIPNELKDSEEYQQLWKLKMLRKQKIREEGHHIGYKCDSCERDPIVGTRWHCMDCPTDMSLDLCDQCCDSSFETATHNANHVLEPIRLNDSSRGPHIDTDYTKFTTGDYNYLDPNYIPPS